MKEISAIIKTRRNTLKLTQMELSILAKVDYNTLRKIESYSVKNPSFITVMKLFSALHIDMWEFGKILGLKF